MKIFYSLHLCLLRNKPVKLFLLAILFSAITYVQAAPNSAANPNVLSVPLSTNSSLPIHISFWHAMDGNRGRVLASLVQEFNLTHPAIIVHERFIGTKQRFANHYNVLIRELLLSIKKEAPPVLAQVYESWTTQFIEAEAIIPMEQFFTGQEGLSTEEVEDFIPLLRLANTYNGKLWTLPFNKSLYVLYYNANSFKKKRLHPPRTWEEFRETAKRLTVISSNKRAIARYGFVFQPSVDLFGILLYSHGGEYFNEKEPAFNNPIGILVLQYLTDLVVRDKVAYPSYQPVEDFIQGKADMIIATTPVYTTLSKQAKPYFKVGIAPLPRGTEDRSLMAGTNLAVFAKTTPEQQHAAWLFIKWLLSKEHSVEWAVQTGYIPVRVKGIQSPYYRQFLARNPELRPIVRGIDKAKGDPKIEAWESVRWIITEAIELSVTQTIQSQTALDEAAAKVRFLFKAPLQY